MGLLTSRSKVMGLPIGPEKVDWDRIAKLGLGAVAVLAATTAAKLLKGATSSVADKGREVLSSATDVADTVSDVREGAADSSTGIGAALGAFKAIGGDDEDGDRDGDTANLLKQRLIIREQVDVGVPRSVAYDQWTQFEDFPNIFRGVENVDQRDDETTSWTGKIGPARRRWKAEIIEQEPDERITWMTRGGVNHRGVVTFHELDDALTRVQVEMEYFPQGVVERFANLFLTVRHRVRKDLRLFKHFIELRGEATGAWRGEIEGDGIGTEAGHFDSSSDGEPARDDQGRFVAAGESSGNGDGGSEEADARERAGSRDG